MTQSSDADPTGVTSSQREKDPVFVHVLYMDIVDSTGATVNQQDWIKARLNETVIATREFQEASAKSGVISLPTGDGMALVFLRKLEGPLRCAIEIASVLRSDPFCGLRMGIHSGPVIVERNINERPDVSGDGINLAARVMSCGGAGHILLTRNAAEQLYNFDAWKTKLHHLGEYQVKKDRIVVWSFVDGEIGSDAPLMVPSLKIIRKSILRRRILVGAIVASAATALAIALVALAVQSGILLWRAPEGSQWSGVVLAGAEIALGPRVSPDGNMLAFQVLEERQNQVAIMTRKTGAWNILTHQKDLGLVIDMSWSPDGSRIYFDRRTYTPQGIFSVPMVGGEVRLLKKDAMAPQALPDGSLIIAMMNAERQLQLHQFWPETQRTVPLRGYVDPVIDTDVPVRVFPDGKEIVFFGHDEAKPGVENHLYALDLASQRSRRLGLSLPLFPVFDEFPLAVTPDGRSVLTSLMSGAFSKIIAIDREGRRPPRTLFTLTLPIWYLDAGRDGSVYADQILRPNEILRIHMDGGTPERVSMSQFLVGPLVSLTDRRVIGTEVIGPRSRLAVARPGSALVPFLDTARDTAFAVALPGDREVAFLIGLEGQREIAIATIADRIVHLVQGAKGEITSLACSPDGKTLYYTALGSVWAIPRDGGAARKVHAGDSVAADPQGKTLIVKLNEKDGFRLVRVLLDGGDEQEIRFRSEDGLRLTPDLLMPNAVGVDGRIVIAAISPDSWYYYLALLDPKAKTLVKTPVVYLGDLLRPGWTKDGDVIVIGARMYCTIWRFWPEEGKLPAARSAFLSRGKAPALTLVSGRRL